jgi:hypothetical protein
MPEPDPPQATLLLLVVASLRSPPDREAPLRMAPLTEASPCASPPDPVPTRVRPSGEAYPRAS